MKEREFIGAIKGLGLGVFTVSDAAKVLHMSGPGLNIYLQRLSDRGAISRIERGKYRFSDVPDEVVASGVVVPSYISFQWALSFHGLSTQRPSEIVVAALRRHSIITLGISTVRFVVMSKERFFGMEKHPAMSGESFAVATPEKAIIDSLCYSAYCPVSEAVLSVKAAVDDGVLDRDRLVGFAKRMGSTAALKRLGLLLYINGMDLSKELGPFVNGKYDPLDPVLPLKGRYDGRWHIIVNTEV